MPTVLITAMEASADALGAALMAALRRRLGKEVRFIGVGGPLMTQQGLDSLFDPHELAVVGVWEGLKVWGRVRRRAREVAQLAARERPDVAVLIDAWGFSIRTAHRLRAAAPGLKLVKYVSPQVWATRPGRARQVAAAFDHLLSILPMDGPYYEGLPIAVSFVGHPVLARDPPAADPTAAWTALGVAPDAPLLLVLPGSRSGEIRRMMPVFGEAVARLQAQHPDLAVVIPAAAAVAGQVKAAAASWPVGPLVMTDEGLKSSAFAVATVALACSGTVTSELAMAGRPMVVAYKVSPLTAAIARMIIHVRYATLFNIAADRAIAPEFIQSHCTADNLVRAVAQRLDDPDLRARQVREQFEALDRLGRGGPDPTEASAEVIAGMLSRS